VLTKVADDFLWAAQVCRDRGYDEVNLNVGCPSGTVVSKGKGSGMLRDMDALNRFLDEIFHASPLPISVKTRLGLEKPEEFHQILEIYNRYPIKELTIHPRVRKQFYDGNVEMEYFLHAMENSTNPLCYNGDILCMEQAEQLQQKLPQLQAIMIGRGLVADPGMLTGGTDRQTLKAFLTELSDTYCTVFGSKRNAIYRMKDNWHYLISLFEGSDKLWKEMRKSTDYDRFMSIANEIIETLPMREHPEISW
jgi:tRNA-dihydrouridine synthase